MEDEAYISESEKNIPIFQKCDVLVVGGGPSGCAAATSAGRMGADTLLLERYGYLGGLSTGGLVVWIDRMTDWSGNKVIQGFAEDIINRLPEEFISGPEKRFWGAKDPDLVEYWTDRSAAQNGVVNWSPTVDPEMLKNAYLDIVLDRNVRLIFHTWAVSVIKEKETIRGVIVESKSGRQAILAKTVVDATGDGDIFFQAGASFESDSIKSDSHSRVNVSFIFGGLNLLDYFEFKHAHPDEFNRILKKGNERIKGFPTPYPLPRNDAALFMGPRYSGYSSVSVKDLTAVEIRSRKDVIRILEFYKTEFPGFENAFVQLTAPQIGVRHARRLRGQKKMTLSDCRMGTIHEDEIAVSPSLNPDIPNVSVPMGCLIPRNLTNVLVAGRSLSCDAGVHTFMREIPQCWTTGQAAGVMAAMSAAEDAPVQDMKSGPVKSELIHQGAFLR